MNLYKKCTTKPYSFLVIDTTLTSDNPLRFRKNLLKKYIKVTMAINDKIRDGKLQYNINKETRKISELSSGKIDKYEYLTNEEILPSDQSRTTEQAKLTALLQENPTKTIEGEGKKQIKAIENRFEKIFLEADQKSIASLFSKEF